MTGSRSSLIICLGANLPSKAGTPAQTFVAVISGLAAHGMDVRAVSRFYETPCFPAGAGPDYVNAALVAETRLDPKAVLAQLHELECTYGRNRATRWAQRTLDMDLIAYDDVIVPDRSVLRDWMRMPVETQQIAVPDRLILPHPRMQDRPFVLVPVCDVAADWRHPVLGQTVWSLRDALDWADLSLVRPL